MNLKGQSEKALAALERAIEEHGVEAGFCMAVNLAVTSSP
jgi:hypothetical protein